MIIDFYHTANDIYFKYFEIGGTIKKNSDKIVDEIKNKEIDIQRIFLYPNDTCLIRAINGTYHLNPVSLKFYKYICDNFDLSSKQTLDIFNQIRRSSFPKMEYNNKKYDDTVNNWLTMIMLGSDNEC